MRQLVCCLVIAIILAHWGSVNSHRNHVHRRHEHPDSAHGGGASFHHNKHPEHHGEGHGGGTILNKDEREYPWHIENQTADIEPKFLSLAIVDGTSLRFKPEKLIVFNDERYEPWSNWSDCIVKDCIEFRFRKCKDNSWTTPSSSKIHTSRCLSKFYAEKRPCQNKTLCNSHIIPEKLSETCGIRPNNEVYAPKIIGGEETIPHSWPWAVRLSVKPPGRPLITFCAGTLVAPQWVLTAAHCLLVENKRLPVGRMVDLRDYMKSALYVHFGDHHRTKKEEAQQDIRVERVIIHPRYHRKLMADGYDIALLYLPSPVKLTPQVGYACLPTKDVKLEPGTKCYAVGWGSTKPGRSPTFDDIGSIFGSLFNPSMNFPSLFSRPFQMSPFFRRSSSASQATDKLREVDLPVLSAQECSKYYPDINDEVNICAGTKGKDTCAGDSGGGLYCQYPKTEKWYAAGVTSFGLAHGCGKQPGVYTSVIGHLDWVTEVMATSVF